MQASADTVDVISRALLPGPPRHPPLPQAAAANRSSRKRTLGNSSSRKRPLRNQSSDNSSTRSGLASNRSAANLTSNKSSRSAQGAALIDNADPMPQIHSVRSDDVAPLKSVPLLLPEIRKGLIRIIHLQGKLSEECGRRGSIDSFQLAERHLRNLTYVGGHLVASGADIVAELTDACHAFRKKDLARFGYDIGRAWRKVLLININHLPEGARVRRAIRETSKGLVQGFFGADLTLTRIALRHNSIGGRSGSSRNARAKEITIDFNQCVHDENMQFFAELWDATWVFFGQLASSSNSSGSDKQVISSASSPNFRWEALLAVAIADMPQALKRCGMTPDQSATLEDSLKALQRLQFHIDVPRQEVFNKEVSVNLAQAIQDWKDNKWHDFGMDMGRLLQELVLLVFPERYSLDGARDLQKQLHVLERGVVQLLGTPGGRRESPLSVAPAFALPFSIALLAVAAWSLRGTGFCSQHSTSRGAFLQSDEYASDSDML